MAMGKKILVFCPLGWTCLTPMYPPPKNIGRSIRISKVLGHDNNSQSVSHLQFNGIHPSLPIRRQELRLSNCLEAQRHRINCHEYARYPRVLSFYKPLTQSSCPACTAIAIPGLRLHRHRRRISPSRASRVPPTDITTRTPTATYSRSIYCHGMPRHYSPTPSLPEHNNILLTRDLLISILYDLSLRLSAYFPTVVRLVVHGGAVMVLHPLLACRDSTRDVDYIHRSFEAEWIARGVTDASARLRTCIKATARKFQLGADWMNACADRALPVSQDIYGRSHDPICNDALSANNVTLNTIFTSPGLVLIGVGWAWAVALKLVRYDKYDPHDIACILRLGQRQRNVQWTRSLLEAWLLSICGAMGYATYPAWQMEATRQKMRHAIALACSQESPHHLPSPAVMRVY